MKLIPSRLTLLIGFMLAAAPAAQSQPPAPAIGANSYDVIVYDGTSGGAIAAVAAARLGKKVALIEPSRHLGGMSSGGLGWTDNGATDRFGRLSDGPTRRNVHYRPRTEQSLQ